MDVSRGPPFGSFPCWRPLLVRASRAGANASVFGRPSETTRDRASSLGTRQVDEHIDSCLLAVTDPSCDSHVRRVEFLLIKHSQLIPSAELQSDHYRRLCQTCLSKRVAVTELALVHSKRM